MGVPHPVRVAARVRRVPGGALADGAENPAAAFLLLPALAAGLIYGYLRFSGRLLYAADGWDSWSKLYHYTNQTNGASFLFCSGCLLLGVLLALLKAGYVRRK